MATFSSLRSDVFSREQRRQHYGSHVMGLNAYDRHKKFMNDYANHYAKPAAPSHSKLLKTDFDTLRETYRFIRSEEDDLERTWEQRLARRYHDKLFKEYCIADMSRYRESKIGLRWRSEKEVVSGKGQFVCGNKNCDETEGLHSYEVNFAYIECGESRQALVKLRVCPNCAYKLNYRKEMELESRLEKEQAKLRKKRERKSRAGGKRSRRRKSDECSSEEDRSSGDGDNSENSDRETPVEASQSRETLNRMPAQDVAAKTSHSSSSKQNDEFDQYFEGMFL